MTVCQCTDRYFYRIIQTEALTHPAAKHTDNLDEMLQGKAECFWKASVIIRLVIEDIDLAVLTFSSGVQQFLRRILLDETEDLEWEEERFIQNFCTLYQGR
jgi:hypothetical protein